MVSYPGSNEVSYPCSDDEIPHLCYEEGLDATSDDSDQLLQAGAGDAG